MHVAVTGSSGLVGSRVVPRLLAEGHRVTRLVRRQAEEEEWPWDPMAGNADLQSLAPLDAVVHLAGENIAGQRWTESFKQRVRDSRVVGTRALSEAMARCDPLPQVLVAASAVGYYGDRGDEVLDERSPRGEGFLARTTEEWEQATAAAREAGIRVVLLRFGMILTTEGGALAKMLTPFRLGAGGIVGSGRQYWSWISLDDAVGAILHALADVSRSGPVNAVSPHPVTNAEFTRALGAALRRPTFIPLPAFAARLALGEMADALLLCSARVAPRRLLESGYRFRHSTLDEALCELLGKP